MVPLIRCMEDDQKEKLNVVFEQEFQRLNLLLSQNGFPTCDSFNKTSFKTDDVPKYESSIPNTHFKHINPSPKMLSSDIINDYEYFLPTQPSVVETESRRRALNARNNRRHYKSSSKILI